MDAKFTYYREDVEEIVLAHHSKAWGEKVGSHWSAVCDSYGTGGVTVELINDKTGIVEKKQE